jgi:3-oxoacyl-(acyl-carrier-protein) synthase
VKYFRRYAVAAFLIICVTAVAAGIAAVDESAKRISLGQVQEVVVRGEEASVIQPASVTDIEPMIDIVLNIFVSSEK